MSEAFDPAWLALREPFDARARSTALANRLIELLPQRPLLVDLGAGTGSLLRWLAPRIGRAQVWRLVDSDTELLDQALLDTARWAERRGWTVTFPERAMLVHAPGGAWRIETHEADLADAHELPLDRAHAVLCSALLDLVSRAWIEEFADLLETPFLAFLTIDGRNRWLPRHPDDALVASAVRRDQARDKGLGAALGVNAPHALMRVLGARGFQLASAASDWVIPPGAMAMLQEMVSGTAQSASAALPARSARIRAWLNARSRQVLDARLAIRIGHRDILAIPGEG